MTKRRRFYTDKELKIFGDTRNGVDPIKSLKIFEELKEVAQKGGAMSEEEKLTFCIAASNSDLSNVNNNYECCKDVKFWIIYLTYAIGIAGGYEYKKFDPEKAKNFRGNSDIFNLKDFLSIVPIDEVNRDLEFLYDIAALWEPVMLKPNHSDPLLKVLSKETRDELKELDRTVQNDPYAKGKFKYKMERRAVLLHSKYIHRTVKSILEKYDKAQFVIKLWDVEVHITILSLVHIIRRHFAQGVRKFIPYTDTSYHNEDVQVMELPIFLKEVFLTITELAIDEIISIEKVIFAYNNTTYFVCIKNENSPLEGINSKIWRLVTFYPITNTKIPKGWDPYKLRNGIYIYFPKE